MWPYICESNKFYNRICLKVWKTLFSCASLYLCHWEAKYGVVWNRLVNDASVLWVWPLRCPSVRAGRWQWSHLSWHLFPLAGERWTFVAFCGILSRGLCMWSPDLWVSRGKAPRQHRVLWGSEVSSGFQILVVSMWFRIHWLPDHKSDSSFLHGIALRCAFGNYSGKDKPKCVSPALTWFLP